jgi:SAM-dependent methyltransferase
MKVRTDPVCPLCHREAPVQYRFERYQVAFCSACDLAFNVYPPGHSLMHLFADQYVDSITAGSLLQKYVARRRFGTISELPPGTLLEVGCGVGYFLRAASARFRVVGLDNSTSVLEKARQLAPAAATLCTENLPEQRFDLICGFHVFEHLTDPVAFAEAVRERLTSGGHFYIRIPNRSSALARIQGERFYLEGHCSHFSPRSLRKALELAGFSQIRLWTDSFAGRWLATLAAPLISAGSRAIQPINQAYAEGKRTHGSRFKRAALAAFHFSELVADVAFRPILASMSRRGRGDELVAIAKP